MFQPNLEGVGELWVQVASVNDIVTARQKGRTLCEQLGFSMGEATLVATAISELARNIVQYAQRGEIVLRPGSFDGRTGIEVIARDRGPGIRDVKRVLQPGYTTSGGLGLGLPGVRRIVDDFQIVSKPQHGTTVTIVKWRS